MPKTTKFLLLLATCVAIGFLVPRDSHAQVVLASATTRTASNGLADLKAQLRQLVSAEEQYFKRHGAYTTDLAALHLMDSTPRPKTWTQVIYAGGRSWSGRAVLSGPITKSCVIFVGDLRDSPQAPLTEVDHAAPLTEGTATCDR
jgi:hypothetical protein